MKLAVALVLVASVAHAGPARLIWLSDSTGACTGCETAASAPARVLGQRMGLIPIDLSVPGARVTAVPGAEDVLPGMQAVGETLAFLHGRFGFGDGATLVILLGVNDWSAAVPLDEFAAAYDRLLTAASLAVSRVVCITPLWNARQDARLDTMRAVIATQCRAMGAEVIDGEKLVPPSLFDGPHPTDKGSRRLAARLDARL